VTGVDRPTSTDPTPAAFPPSHVPSHEATVVLTGYDPNEADEQKYFAPRRVKWIPRQKATGNGLALT
jgi:hypothetical protein